MLHVESRWSPRLRSNLLHRVLNLVERKGLLVFHAVRLLPQPWKSFARKACDVDVNLHWISPGNKRRKSGMSPQHPHLFDVRGNISAKKIGVQPHIEKNDVSKMSHILTSAPDFTDGKLALMKACGPAPLSQDDLGKYGRRLLTLNNFDSTLSLTNMLQSRDTWLIHAALPTAESSIFRANMGASAPLPYNEIRCSNANPPRRIEAAAIRHDIDWSMEIRQWCI